MLTIKRESPGDPDDVMTGRCTPCRLVVEVPRWQARKPDESGPSRHAGAFTDCWYCGCPACGARVYLMTRPDQLVKKKKKDPDT